MSNFNSNYDSEFIIPSFQDFTTIAPNGKRYILKIDDAKDNVIISPFRRTKYSPFPSEGGLFNITNDQRDYVSLNYNENVDDEYIEKYGDNSTNDKYAINILNGFTTQYNLQKEKIFENNKSKAKKGKLVSDNYFFLPLLKDNNDEGEKTKPITFRTSFNKKFTLYYKNEKLDVANNKIINNTLFPKGGKSKKGDEFKKFKESLTFNIFWPQGSQEKLLVPYTDLEEKKEFKVNVIYREVETDEKIKKPNEFTNEDLNDPDILEEFNKLYGEPKAMIIETPQELEKYCKAAYYRIGYIVPELWVEANPSAKGKQMDAGFKAYCVCIDIVNIKTKYTNTNTNKNSIVNKMYKNMAFENKVDNKVENKVDNKKVDNKKVENKKVENNKSGSEESEEDSDYEIEEVEVSESEEEEEIIVKKPTKVEKKK
jgi:hypothetical protein